MIVTTQSPDTVLVIRFRPDKSPQNPFLRVGPTCNKRFLQFQIASDKDNILIIEQVAVVDSKPHRHKFIKSTWQTVTIDAPTCGTFKYYIESKCRPDYGYIQFPPMLPYGLTVNDIRLQTILTKWITPEDFKHKLVPSVADIGYNLIHFVPIQTRGHSDSPYSIRDQLSLSSDFGEDAVHREATLESMLKACDDHKLLKMVDVVWNHTACDSEWLLEHPEAGYTLKTAPWLRIAWELDEAILAYSRELEQSSAGIVSDEDDLALLMHGLVKKVDELLLHEYFTIDIDVHLSNFNPSISSPHNEDIALLVQNDGQYGRFSNFIDMSIANANIGCKDKLLIALENVNARQMIEFESIRNSIIENCKARVRYERLALDGPKLGPISSSSPLLSSYFTRLLPLHSTEPLIFANNGWIWDADPLTNFAEAPGLAYLKRDIIIWGDCVKLRYGQKPQDCPWLWRHMAEYTRKMANCFDALRIDNCHSTPLCVARGLLAEARSVNPSIYVVAELFTGRSDRDELFVGELGIDSLIRESMASGNPAELAASINHYSTPVISAQPHALLMDCTHDNPSPSQKRTAVDALPNAAIVAMASCAIGSVRGYDQLCPKHLNIVAEKRKYLISSQLSPIEELKKLFFAMRQSRDIKATEVDGLITVSAIQGEKEFILFAKTAFAASEKPTQITLPKGGKMVYSGQLVIDPEYSKDPQHITGYESRIVPVVDGNMHPGSILLIEMPHNNTQNCIAHDIDAYYKNSDNWTSFSSLSLLELNMLMYRTDAEESDMNPSYGVYVVPNFGPLSYCGVAGFHLALKQASFGVFGCLDPFTENVRNGTWMLDYTVDRLKVRQLSKDVIKPIEGLFALIKLLDRVARPKQTFRAFHALHEKCCDRAKVLLNAKSELELQLALGLVQMFGRVQSTGLDPISQSPSLAAGLPHFTTNHMRCWGRDTFTSYRGFFLLSNRLEEGRQLLEAFGACLFHGLIPNLLDAQRFPRFNSRDAVWWFCYALLMHAKLEPTILDVCVEMRFPNNQYINYDSLSPEHGGGAMSFRKILASIFANHAQGIKFVEHNAGPSLDPHMTNAGFEVSIHVDWSTGVLYGGNKHNCGTWMDKMGSVPGVNKGQPSTARNGAAIEINALCLCVLDMFLDICGDIDLGNGCSVAKWHALLSTNFDSVFFNQTLGHYNDCIASHGNDGQLRPNFLIATSLIYDFLDPEHVCSSLTQAKHHLLGAIGMKTLSPKDPQYDPIYNLDDNTNGANYHNGPEWPWLTAFYIRSLKKASLDLEGVEEMFAKLDRHISMNPMGGVVELTNLDGAMCQYSCQSQAWSMACLREALIE